MAPDGRPLHPTRDRASVFQTVSLRSCVGLLWNQDPPAVQTRGDGHRHHGSDRERQEHGRQGARSGLELIDVRAAVIDLDLVHDR